MILLIGNFLSKHGLNPTAIEDLAIVLSERYEVKKSSDKRFSPVRLLDMAKCVISNQRDCKLIIVDVFSTKALIFSFLVIFLANWYKIPYIPVLRGGNLPARLNKYPRVFNLFFSSASMVICPSQYLQKCVKGNNYPTTIIPNYINLKSYSFKIREKIKPYLLWVRSIHKIYNPLMAIHVLDQIRKIYPDAKLCLVGPIKDDKLMKKIEIEVVALNLNEHITFCGQMSKPDWIKLSNNYDIFINTTNYDNHPISIIEAMALGLPVISTNAGGINDLIQDKKNGLLVDKADIMAMVEEIKYLINGKVDAKLISTNAREFVENFDTSIIIKKWEKLILPFYKQ